MVARDLDTLVALPSGSVTLRTLNGQGRLTWTKVEKLGKRGGGTRRAYFADLDGGPVCIEVTATLYRIMGGK